MAPGWPSASPPSSEDTGSSACGEPSACPSRIERGTGSRQPCGLLEELSSDRSDPALGEGVRDRSPDGCLEDLEAFGGEGLVAGVGADVPDGLAVDAALVEPELDPAAVPGEVAAKLEVEHIVDEHHGRAVDVEEQIGVFDDWLRRARHEPAGTARRDVVALLRPELEWEGATRPNEPSEDWLLLARPWPWTH